MTNYVLRLGLLVLAGIRLFVAARAPLSADEAYYWVWSRALATGYLDHPPMVALWIRAGTAVAGDTALGVRLLGPVSALLGSLLLLRAAEDFSPERHTGPVAVLLLNATLALNVGAVVMTPDTPLLFFWTAALACLARLVRSDRPGWWLGVGLCAGLALDSKYTAGLLGAATLVWLLAVPGARRWLRCWQLWVGGSLALAMFAPVLAWNAAHGWASFAKQAARTGDWQPARAVGYLAELAAGQIGLATPGIAWVPGLLACVTLLPACVFVQHALGDRVQANWPAVVFPGAALAAAGGNARFWRPSVWLGAVCALLLYVQAVASPWALPRALDFTLIRLAGWSDLAGRAYAAQLANHAGYVAADEYGLACELAWRLHTPVVGVEPRWALFSLPSAPAGEPGLLVRSLREGGAPDPHLWADVRLVGGAVRARRGEMAERYNFYLARRMPSAPAVTLPSARPAPFLPSPAQPPRS